MINRIILIGILLQLFNCNVFFAQKTIVENFHLSYQKNSLSPSNSYISSDGKPTKIFYIPVNTNNYELELNIISEHKKDTNINSFQIKQSNSYNYNHHISEQRFKKYVAIELETMRLNNGAVFVPDDIEIRINQLPPTSKPSLRAFATNSVLSSGSGDWHKIGVIKNGVYKIDYNYLQSNGIIQQSITSDAINIYGNGQGMLTEINGQKRVDDLQKNAIFIEDGNDGTFGPGDYILFYAFGPHNWYFQNNDFSHNANNYSDTSYYFININTNGTGKRIQTATLPTGTSSTNLTSYINYDFIEPDEINLGKSGIEWFGDIYDVQTTYNYKFTTPNILSSASSRLNVRLIGKYSSAVTSFTVNCNGSSINIPVPSSGSGTYAAWGQPAAGTMMINGSGNETNISVTYNKNSYPSAKGYTDYLEFIYRSALNYNGGQLFITDTTGIGPGNISTYTISNGNSIEHMWDITSPYDIKEVPLAKTSNSASFKFNNDSIKYFIAFNNSFFNTPYYHQPVQNQNLHGLSNSNIVIITVSDYSSASEDLANFHYTHDGLTSAVVTTQQIYNEFSSGMQDPTAIKQFLRMFYKRANGNPSLIPEYCILMGDASYDNRNRMGHNKKLIPTYESKESLSVTGTYATDDYYAILSDGGAMNNYDLLDIAIGRFTVNSLQEANDMVNKVKYYCEPQSNSSNSTNCCSGTNGSNSILRDWRNVVCMISDDGDNNMFFNDTEIMADTCEANNKNMNIVKIHSDAYAQISTAGGQTIPGAEEAIKQQVEKGALLVSYIGHGGEVGWAHERILKVETINGWQNISRMPVFMTATCEFSRYDDHDRTSAGEYVILNPNGGGIASFTTTRLVYAGANEVLNKYFHSIFYDKINGTPQRIGDIYYETKIKYVLGTGGDANYRKFTLLGDPAVRLAMPQHQIITDSINSIEINSFNDTIKALSKVKIAGHIEDYNGQLLTGFNGYVYPILYDKISDLMTLGDGTDNFPAPFQMWKNKAYKGKATVTNGKFSFELIVPKDIALQIGHARLSYYAENGTEDAQGYNEVPLIGGINTDATADNTGPTIDLYMNNESFVSGGITDANPSLYAKLFDENGINMVGSGIGHNIEAVIDENTADAIVLNDYYESDLNTYKSGKVSYPFSSLKTGNHTLSLKAWDTYNNSNKTSIEFVVAKNEKMALDHVLNYPNPFTTYTEFFFEHNQVCDYLDVQIQVFTISGALVKTIDTRIQSDGFRSTGIAWNGLDDYGDQLAKGVYVYKLTVVNNSNEKAEKFEKLVLLR